MAMATSDPRVTCFSVNEKCSPQLILGSEDGGWMAGSYRAGIVVLEWWQRTSLLLGRFWRMTRLNPMTDLQTSLDARVGNFQCPIF